MVSKIQSLTFWRMRTLWADGIELRNARNPETFYSRVSPHEGKTLESLPLDVQFRGSNSGGMGVFSGP